MPGSWSGKIIKLIVKKSQEVACVIMKKKKKCIEKKTKRIHFNLLKRGRKEKKGGKIDSGQSKYAC